MRGFPGCFTLLSLGLAALGCGDIAPTFRCTSDQQCQAAASGGHCELSGYCSFPDSACASGLRYDPSAAPAYAGHCTSDLIATDGGSGVFVGGGTLIFSGSFQDGGVPSTLFEDEQSTDALQVVAAPWDATHKALRVEIDPGETFGTGGPTSQITIAFSQPAAMLATGTQYRFTGAFWFDTGSLFSTAGAGGAGELDAIFHIASNPAAGNPIRVFITNGNLMVELNNDAGGTRYAYGAVPLGERLPYEVVYKPSSGSDGYVRVAIGDQLVVEHSGPSAFAGGTTGGYPQWLLSDYNKILTTSLAVYFDDVAIYQY